MDESLTEPRPLLSLEVPGTFRSMAYTRHLNDATHYLFLGTSGGRLFQVGLSVLFYTGVLDCENFSVFPHLQDGMMCHSNRASGAGPVAQAMAGPIFGTFHDFLSGHMLVQAGNMHACQP